MKAFPLRFILPLTLLGTALFRPPAAHAYQIRGVGEAALVGHDLTDPEDDGDPENNVNYNAIFSSSEEAGFGGDQAAFNVFDNRAGGGSNDKWCCGDQNNFPANPISIDATFASPVVLRHFTLTSGEDVPERDPRVWQVQGSNDGVTFTTIYARNNPTTAVWTARSQVVEFTAGSRGDYAVPPAYTTIRFITTATGLSSGGRFQLGEIEYFATTPQSLEVTTTADENDGSSDPSAGAGTSLREALLYASTLTGAQTITFSNSTANGAVNFSDGTARTITVDATNLGALPNIAGDVSVTGPGARLLAVTSNDTAIDIFTVDGGAKGTFDALTISGGHAGIRSQGTLTVRDCTISGNLIQGISSEAATATTVANCALTGNKNGISIATTGTVTATNCTISGSNSGVFNNAGTATFTHCTISGNTTGTANTAGTLTAANSIVAGNGTNSSGSITNVNNSSILSGTATGAGLEVDGNGDPVLTNNGGPTDTIKLLPGSAAIDAGDNSLAVNENSQTLAYEQRGLGFDRLVKSKSTSNGALVDIGAYEVQLITFTPGVEANGVPVDAADGPLDLTGPTIGAMPPGGTFSGPGVDANGIFHPELLDPGIYLIAYTTTTPDAYGNTGSKEFAIIITATKPYVRVIATVGPGGTGIDVPNEPTGTKFTQLGLASMDVAEIGKAVVPVVAARVRIQPAGGTEVPAIYQGSARGGIPVSGAIAVRGGDAAPNGSGGTLGTFASFQEPVFGAGYYAFGATITGGGVSKANDTGLWSSRTGQLDLVAGEGGTATDGVGMPMAGVFYDKIQSYVLSADGEALSFVATLKGAGVTGANKTGVFQYRTRFDFMSSPIAPSTKLIFRTGDIYSVTTNFSKGTREDQPIKSLTLFAPAKTIPGQRRSYANSGGELFAFAKFKSPHVGLLRWTDNGFFFYGRFFPLENTTLGHPGVPSINNNGYFAMRAGLSIGAPYTQGPGKVTAKDDQVILTGRSQNNIGILSQEGSPVSSTNPEVFTAFDEPAFNDNYRTAFFAKVKAPGLPANQQRVLIYDAGDVFNYEPRVIARTGTPAADLTGGVLWKEFTAMALPDSDYGPVFLAKLSGPGVTKMNSIGLWATDLDGTVRLLVRTGDAVSVNGASKTVTLITTLGAALDSPGQGRYVDLEGNVSATLTFTDGTVALVHFGMPTTR